MKYLIDTDWVIDHIQGDSTATALIASLTPDGIAISIITFLEIYEGIYTSADPKQTERLVRVFIQTVPVLPLSRTVAKRTALVRSELRRKGRSVRQRAFDIVIAATALTHRLTLVTRNTADYRAIDGLNLY
ncbi:MAG TPA: type II toxin-antitoxin system VapC family toxin [Chloroflexota bacterium]|nr:type II toxin-antitoxin system VapC family toxin [Chloroflexota bacterium]